MEPHRYYITKSSYHDNVIDDDHDDDDDAYSLSSFGMYWLLLKPHLPTIDESNMFARMKSKQCKLAYTKYYQDRPLDTRVWAYKYPPFKDPLKTLVLLDAEYATALAEKLNTARIRDNIRVLKIFMGKFRANEAYDINAASALGRAIGSCPYLTHLTIRRISDLQGHEVLGKLFDGITNSSQSCRSIQKLSLQSTWNGADFSQIVSSLPNLKTLNVRGECDMVKLSSSLQLSSITRLEIVKGMLGRSTIRMLSAALPYCRTLKSLSLAYNKLDAARITKLFECWTPEVSIEDLDLSWNRIGEEGAVRVLQACAMRPHLTSLSLNYNPRINFVGIARIGKELGKIYHLKKLQIWCCSNDLPYNSRGVFSKPLKKAMYSLQDGVKSNCSLVDLYFNWWTPESAYYTALNRCGRYLLALDHQVTSTVWCHVLEKCGKEPIDEDTKSHRPHSLVYFFVREQPQLFLHRLPSKTSG